MLQTCWRVLRRFRRNEGGSTPHSKQIGEQPTERPTGRFKMAETYTLEAQTRTVLGKKVKNLRKQDLIPAVIYGVGGEPIHVAVVRRPLEVVLQQAGGTHIINITVDGTTHNTLVRDVQRHVIRKTIQHVDFLRVDLTKSVRTEVPVVLVGLPKLGGDLELLHNIQSVEVETLPTNIPDRIEVNAARLSALGDQITVADLPKIEGVEYLADEHDVIARISSNVPVAEDMGDELAPSEPEVVERGKKAAEDEDF
jgi:large subunit ribosomal protein L25